MEEGWEEMREHLKEYIVDLKDYHEIKTIGKGAFGKVYLATKKNTNEKFAIKELFFEHLEGRQLKLFCREVQILAKCHNLFLLPFRGFTLSFPYSIITEYITNGSLYEALRHRPKAPILTPTHKTIIALGIANGMCHLHELNIIHRDLKSLNILLDEHYYPKICDFGIARFKTESNQPVTQQIGTPHWMAPELFLKNNYDSKVDVYAFGIILWELITEQIPFMGQNPIQIMTAVCQNHERPPLPEDAPPKLVNLINLCWAHSPQERPTFKIIFDLFKKKRVYFEGTDFAQVDKVIEAIQDAELAQKLSKGTPLPQVEDLSTSEVNVGLNCLKNYSSPTFPSALNQVLDTINETNIHEFFSVADSVIEQMDSEALIVMIKALQKLISKNETYLTLFISNALFAKLPFNNNEVFPVLYQLLGGILQEYPSAINQSQMQSIFTSFDKYPQQITTLFYMVSKDFDESYSANKIIEFMFEKAEVVIKAAGAGILQIIDELLQSHKDLFERYFDQLKNLLMLSFADINKQTVKFAYRILAQYFDERLVPPQLVTHLKDPFLTRDALIILNMTSSIKVSENLITILLNNISHRYAYIFILKTVPNYSDLLFTLSYLWILNPSLQIENSLRLLVKIVDNQHITPNETQAKLVLSLFMEVMKLSNPPLSSIAHVLRKIELTKPTRQIFERSKFLSKFTDIVLKKPTTESVHSCLALMNMFVQSNFTNDFLRLLPKVQDIIESNPTLIFLSMSIIIKIGKSEETKRQISQIGFIRSFLQNSLSSRTIQFGNLFNQIEV